MSLQDELRLGLKNGDKKRALEENSHGQFTTMTV
jgi:hypothetical protein